MSSLKDMIEDADVVGKLANRITVKASKRARTRVMLMATVGIVILGSHLGYLTYLQGEYQKSSDEHNAKYGFLVAENQDKRTLDYIELCIEASKDTDANRHYYCSKALDLYKLTFKDMPGGIDENVEKAAFGAMKVDVAARIRSMTLDRTMGQTPAMDSVLKFLLSIAGIVIAVVLAAVGMTATIVYTWRISQAQLASAQNTNPPASPT
ncbi:hypothetical protein [Pseudomonas fluorescens]|uniref:Transmembrane protein n=1 Tax=Pseudomonas fluorescens TaxID=294 RepID=A0A5E7C2K2_PSEFL|nr:hypothetical protein [Pseudomonas fluorescens]VVN98425.1 hypothetical protein PS723_02443 [Pseudomonas fluorescens]